MAWYEGDAFDGVWIAISLALSCGSLACLVAPYMFAGVRAVTISPDGVEIEWRVGKKERHAWADFESVWKDPTRNSRWVFEVESRRVKIYEYGFSFGDWYELSEFIHGYKAAGPVETLPGVQITPQKESGNRGEYASTAPSRHREGTFDFEPQYPSVVSWGPWLFLACAFVSFPIAYGHYAAGTWLENPWESILLPACSVVPFPLILLSAFRRATKVRFAEDGMVIEQLWSRENVVPYRDVLDVNGYHLYTVQGTFIIGQKNDDVFFRLLAPHLEKEQLSGNMWLLEYYGAVGALNFLWLAPVFCVGVWLWGAPYGWRLVAYGGAIAGAAAAAGIISRGLKRRALRTDDS